MKITNNEIEKGYQIEDPENDTGNPSWQWAMATENSSNKNNTLIYPANFVVTQKSIFSYRVDEGKPSLSLEEAAQKAIFQIALNRP